jgi:IS30 family transposase
MNAKLTKDDIQLIRQLKESGITMAEIARKFEVSRSTIQDIFSGRSWRNL